MGSQPIRLVPDVGWKCNVTAATSAARPQTHRLCENQSSGFVIPAKVGRRLDSARIQFMSAGYGSPLSRG